MVDSALSSRLPKLRIGHLALHATLIAGSVVMLLPFAWMLSTSLKEPREIFTYPPVWIPSPIAWENYATTVSVMPFGRFYFNSLVVATSVTILQILTIHCADTGKSRQRRGDIS